MMKQEILSLQAEEHSLPNIVDAFNHCYGEFIAIANLYQDETT